MFTFLESEKLSSEIKNDVINTMLLSSVFIFTPALAISFIRIVVTGWSEVYVIQTALSLLLYAVYLFRSQLKLYFKVYFFQACLFIIGTTGLHYFGYFANTKLLFILIPVFFWFFHTKRVAIWSSLLCMTTFGIYAWLFTTHRFTLPFKPDEFLSHGSSWIMNGLVMISIMIYCIVLFHKLIEVQKSSFSTIEESEERHKFLTENIKDVIWVIDVESGKYTYVSPSVEKVRGYKPFELIGARISDFVPATTSELTDSLLRERLQVFSREAEPHYSTLEIEVNHKNGQTLWMEINSHFRVNPRTNRVELIGTSRDITERKKSRQALEKTNAELDNFVYRISHDIRAPLSSCFGILDAMERESVIDPASQAYYKLLKEALNRQDEVIKNILDYSKNSRGEIQLEKIQLKKLVKLTFRDLKLMEKSKEKVALKMTIEEDFTFISDKSRIQFIMNNLISNALKYSAFEKEKPVIEIQASKTDSATIVSVTDNGIGISEKVLPHIFKMFYRGTLKSTGSGLGLYIVKEAVDKLNGTVSVKSKPGIYTTFTITLPKLQPAT